MKDYKGADTEKEDHLQPKNKAIKIGVNQLLFGEMPSAILALCWDMSRRLNFEFSNRARPTLKEIFKPEILYVG